MQIYEINNKFYQGELTEIHIIKLSGDISENESKKEMSRTLDGKTYTVADFFATDKDFKNLVEPTDDSKDRSKEFGINKAKYILGQYIIDDVAKNGSKWAIIKEIVKEQYNGNWFEFIKASGLVKLDGDKIDKSEMTSYRSSNGDWRPDELGDYGYIWLRALDSNGNPICIRFREDSASWDGEYPKTAMRVASQK